MIEEEIKGFRGNGRYLKIMNPDKDSDYLEIHETDLDITRKVPLVYHLTTTNPRNYASPSLISSKAHTNHFYPNHFPPFSLGDNDIHSILLKF